jgi:hypothetical protein
MKRTIITAILTLVFTAYAIHAVEQTAFSGAGVIESSTGGFKFPDSTVQLTAVTASPGAVGFVDGPHHRFVSSKGNDANACTLALPCRSFAMGVTATAFGGKLVALDSGDYGPFTVTKAITVEAAPGVQASIAVSSGAGVTVNTTDSLDAVILSGLAIYNNGGEDGVNVLSGWTHIQRCSITGFRGGGGDGSQAVHTWTDAYIENSTLIDNDRAVWSDGPDAGVTVNRTRLETNGTGVHVSCGSTAVVRDSVFTNTAWGVKAECGTPSVLVKNSLFSRNGDAIWSNDTGSDTPVIRVTGSSIVFNGTGLRQTGTSLLLSRGDNTVEANGTDTVGTIGSYVSK